MIVILTQDLMMTSSVSAVARQQGLVFKSATQVDRALKLVRENSVSKLFIDLQLPNLNLVELVEGLESVQERPQLVAYAQHVHVDLLSQARKLGLEQVYTRGQVHGGLEALIRPEVGS